MGSFKSAMLMALGVAAMSSGANYVPGMYTIKHNPHDYLSSADIRAIKKTEEKEGS